jgi:hypothetical protein
MVSAQCVIFRDKALTREVNKEEAKRNSSVAISKSLNESTASKK